MKGFIEITKKYVNEKVTIAVSHIEYVEDSNGQAYIVTSAWVVRKARAEENGFLTKESYSEVLAKIKEATE